MKPSKSGCILIPTLMEGQRSTKSRDYRRGVVLAVDEVMSGYSQNGLAAVRPPGHHAMPGYAMGFCILGNVPIATKHAQQAYGIERVMIVDYDVHHGNGTEAMFYKDDSVL